MPFETWATYAVTDHLDPRALALDVLLFDRLVFPVPQRPEPQGNPMQPGGVVRWQDDPEALAHWRAHPDWQVDRQAQVLEILAPVLRRVRWGPENSTGATYAAEAARLAAEGVPDYAFRATRTALTQDLPAAVEGVAVLGPAFRTVEAADRALGQGTARRLPGDVAPVVLAWTMAGPDLAWRGLHATDVLHRAVEFAAGNSALSRKRQAFQTWQRQVVRDGVTDRASLDLAVEALRTLTAEIEAETARLDLGRVLHSVAQLLPVALGAGLGLARPAEALIDAVGIGLGQAAERWHLAPRPDTTTLPAAFILDARRVLAPLP